MKLNSILPCEHDLRVRPAAYLTLCELGLGLVLELAVRRAWMLKARISFFIKVCSYIFYEGNRHKIDGGKSNWPARFFNIPKNSTFFPLL